MISQKIKRRNAVKKNNVKLIIKYNHENDNISPGIIIEDKKGHDINKETISNNPYEKEVILFPFTLRIEGNIFAEFNPMRDSPFSRCVLFKYFFLLSTLN